MSKRSQLPNVKPELKRVDIKALLQHPMNPNRGNVQEIADSMQHLGVYKPVIVQKSTGYILAGNHTVQAAGAIGETEIDVYFVDVSDDHAQKILLADNNIATKARVDSKILTSILEDIKARNGNIEGTSFSNTDLNALLKKVRKDSNEEPKDGALAGYDDIVPRMKRGEILQCGRHIVCCADSTDPKEIPDGIRLLKHKMLITDPPYNVCLDYGDESSDDKTRKEYEVFTGKWLEWAMLDGMMAIITPGWNNLRLWLNLDRHDAIGIWTKLNAMTRATASRFNCWEPILFKGCSREGRAHDVFDYPVGQQAEIAGHPCPKPLKLWTEFMECYLNEGDLVIDPFLGSGTTLIAAENTGMISHGIEIDPKWCEVAIRRWENLTGQVPQSVVHASG